MYVQVKYIDIVKYVDNNVLKNPSNNENYELQKNRPFKIFLTCHPTAYSVGTSLIIDNDL